MPHYCKGKNCKNPEHSRICELNLDMCKKHNRFCYKYHYVIMNNSEILSNKIIECQSRYGLFAYYNYD